MELSKQEIEDRVARFKKVCRLKGAKLTHQRLVIFREVAGSLDHPDADRIFQRVRAQLPTISIDTVYRTLWWLRDLGLIRTLGPSSDATRFDANLGRHHHFVCIQCGLTRDFLSEKLNGLELPESVSLIGHPQITQVEVKGVCLNCEPEKAP